jgi:amino acid adenylation domain-containing protein
MNRQDQSFRLDGEFEEQAKRTPDGVAVLHQGRAITFSDLKSDSDRLARLLRARGVRAGGCVGLHVERSIGYVVSVLAILKSNAAVVPLPPSYPEGRLQDILSFSSLDAIIDDEHTPLGPNLSANVVHLGDAAGNSSAVDSVPPGGGCDHPAFVLCSSGSTGTPKMIVRSHRSFFHRLRWTWDNLPYEVGESCCQKAHMTTTHAIYELFEPLLRGVPVSIVSDQEMRNLEQFWDTIRTRGISRLLIVPSVLQALLDMPGFVAPSLKVLILMGEHVHPKLAGRTLEAFPEPTRIFSIYGSTEASSTLVCDLRASFRPGEELPLGTPLSSDVRAYVLGPDLEEVAPGEVGMLHIAGSPLFTEYFRNPALTASMFIGDPRGEGTLFRTQDQVRRMPDGSLQFVGRIDHTVKIRGFRVDLQEVERALLLHPDVRQCAVLQNDPGPVSSLLVAFVVPGTLAPASVYQVLRDRLPAYMVPSVVVALESFPLTSSGKVDRQRLLAEYVRGASAGPPAPEPSDTVGRVARVWREVLKHDAVQPDSSFFEVGGTSLTVFAAVHRLRKAFKLDRGQLSDLSIYQYPTITALASYIDKVRDGAAPSASPVNSVLVTLKRGGEAGLPPLFLISSAGGTLGSYEKVVKALNTRRDVIGVRDPFLWGDRDPTLGFQHWVARYVNAIRERQPRGPYYLLAYSSAGAFGYEIAQQLRRDDQEVALLALVDPLAMDRATKRRFGYWALQARFMRRPADRMVLLGGWARLAVPDWFRRLGQSASQYSNALTRAEFLQFAAEVRTNRGHIRGLSALLELNTGLPFALTESELAAVGPDRCLDVLLARVKSVAPEIDPGMIENMVVQYQLQVRSQHEYQLQRYDGKVVLVDPAGPYQGLLAAQFRPYVRNLHVRVLRLGPQSNRTRVLSEGFPQRIHTHYLSMRDDTFVLALAQELEMLLR